MIIIVLVSVCFTLCNILLSRYINVTLLLILNIFIWTLGNLWLTRRIHILIRNYSYINHEFCINWGQYYSCF